MSIWPTLVFHCEKLEFPFIIEFVNDYIIIQSKRSNLEMALFYEGTKTEKVTKLDSNFHHEFHL